MKQVYVRALPLSFEDNSSHTHILDEEDGDWTEQDIEELDMEYEIEGVGDGGDDNFAQDNSKSSWHILKEATESVRTVVLP